MVKKIILYSIILTTIACTTSKSKINPTDNSMPISDSREIENPSPKNIIFMIGDGMGLSQISATMYAQGNQSVLEQFQTIGLHKSHAADNLITDSAAGATAFSTGHKTYNGAIAVDIDTMPLRTILEEAEQNNMATGLVSTCSITHATPASYIAHNRHRNNNEEIALGFLQTDIDIFIGGGMEYFESQNINNKNVLDILKEKKYNIQNTINSSINTIQLDPAFPQIVFTADKHPKKASEGRDYLPLASEKVIQYLDKRNEKEFFVMIEGSQIDWGGHANDADYIIEESKDFELAVQKVLNWVIADKETLLIITADHETGGFAINGGTMDQLETAFTTGHHTATMIPVFAYGPGSSNFAGIYENTEIYHKMIQAFNWNKK